ncbi:cytochrome C peroxidase [Vibrio coralliilyticus]|uniref:Cytochrome C peroxidase n=1 Tax=Vibrio coralliilyticus TaxID=190893 RepID=A0A837G7H1_9VIBR|nr:cytochrome c peroxidase [Vibrio coralliilyticus]KJY72959.1 cytochrome C peroxidase [Vibrio coralliilyticus]QOU31828.1 cytochrome C peroxidase [Vibrio coralliilyticus]
MRKHAYLLALTLGLASEATAIPIPDDLDTELRKLIEQHSLTGEPNKDFEIPSVDSIEVKLGKLLFFSKALSGNKDVACASCHHPYLGGGDGLSLAVGTLAENEDVLGPGRKTTTGEFYVARNTPTIFNAGLYKRSLFRDARVEFVDWLDPSKGISTPDVAFGEADPNSGDTLLSAQARFPPVTASEMRGFDFMQDASNEAVRAHLAARIGDYGDAKGELFRNQWMEKFASVYGDDKSPQELVTFANITRALSAYQESMNFTDNAWNQYVKGDSSALTTSQKRGAYLYLYMPPPPSDGGNEPDFLPTQCIGCHNTDTFSQTKDSNYHRLAFPQIGPGTGEPGMETNDLGRAHRNESEADIYSFRSGTLLNIEVTGPFGHAGNYDTLEQVIDHYDDYHQILEQYIDELGWCEQPQFKDIEHCNSLFPDARENTDKAAKIIDDEIADGAPVLQKLNLSDQSKTDLVNFMKALTDPCVKSAECLQAWIPQPEESDPDGLQLTAINYQGVPLYLPSKCSEGETLQSGEKLTRDQGECIAGSMEHFYFDVLQDNTTVYLSSRDGQGDLKLYYHPTSWASKQNALAESIGEGTEQVLIITLNQGRHYVSAISQQGYQGVSIALGTRRANKEPGEHPKAISDECVTSSPVSLGELQSGAPVCTAQGDNYYFIKVTEPNSTLEIRTRHGSGNTDLYVGPYWPSTSQFEFSSRSTDSSEYLRIDSPIPGWYFILAAGDGLNQGTSLQLDISTQQ